MTADEAFYKEVQEDLKRLFAGLDIVVVTAKQYPRPPGYKAYIPKPSDFVFIDYITKIGALR